MNRSSFGFNRGFSLVEVLLAVFVLGIGLLGLAAVFPVVISQQRASSEAIGATGVIASVEALLVDAGGAPGLRAILQDPGFGRFEDSPPVSDFDPSIQSNSDEAWTARATLLWNTTFTWRGHDNLVGSFPGLATSGAIADRFRDSGIVQIGAGPFLDWNGSAFTRAWEPTDTATPPAVNPHPGVTTLPVDARLYPSAYTGSEPRFVWDLALRRTTTNSIEAAIFVRSIETGIRVPPGIRLSDVVTTIGDRSPSATAARRLPVGMNERELRATGRGVQAGAANQVYAHPVAASAWLPSPQGNQRSQNDIIVLRTPRAGGPLFEQGYSGALQSAFSARARGRLFWHDIVAQPGQMIVDNLGVVRRVVGEVEDLPAWFPRQLQGPEVALRVDPPYTASAQRNENVQIDDVTLELRNQQLFQVIFTAQPPVAVYVRELEVR